MRYFQICKKNLLKIIQLSVDNATLQSLDVHIEDRQKEILEPERRWQNFSLKR